MKCPFCDYYETKVVDSRPTEEGHSIRRRRECVKCNQRFTTYEKIEHIPIVVIKKDGTRQEYNRDKIINGLIRACEKRPVSMKQMELIADEVEKNLQNSLKREISSTMIGELVMNQLKDLDEIAYVRFASVYRQFKDLNTFLDELKKMLHEK
ncbi:transcriptional regulator NrdR [Gottschalkiaceae bacterium SANA]|jgi:transcriptional repressor NrdR|nr:transcriptional regulator NrdR [Gottschalkiaceae bacterium SANA]